MLNRVRARMRFTAASGLATWCRDQMQVRYGQAVHINAGEPNEEVPINEVVDDGDWQVFGCDLPLADEAAAADAVATLGDHNVLGQSEPHPTFDGSTPSWVEHHSCDHQEDVRSGCAVVDRREGPA